MSAGLRAVPTGLAALADRVLTDLDGLVGRMGSAYQNEIAEYAVMSEATMTTDVLPVSRRLVEVFLACVVQERTLSNDELSVFEQSGRDRLTMGMPLDSVLHAYRIAGREAWTALCAAVQPGEEPLLADLGARWIDIVDRTSSALARAYLTLGYDRLRDLDARRRELVEALLTATDPSEVAAVSLRFSTVLAPSYVPVLVAGSGAVAGIDALLAEAPAGTLGGHRGERVLLLVPQRLDGPIRRGGTLIAWGRPATCGRGLLEEVRQVEQLLLTAIAEGHAEGTFGPDDLLVEQLLLGNERVADALRRRVADVLVARDPAGVLVGTLRTYLATGSVPETARTEHVHVNTVAYRLGRVRDLTGLDPRVPQNAALLVLGLGLPAAGEE
ncbi:MAG: helix-turn-helix domain-containing protein [Actinobacteria bacterium]|nr:helix-turn-helix domain-containing protein [Actinomycetota bacterium]MCA1722351.1 helix-turn-helix domain-containing protein [Actinomycetota bacterium]